jgi:hypothetical protein
MNSDPADIAGLRNGSTIHASGRDRKHFEDDLVEHLERDQFVAVTSRPVERAALSARTITGLWALRIFVIVVSLMVIYTFVDQLH